MRSLFKHCTHSISSTTMMGVFQYTNQYCATSTLVPQRLGTCLFSPALSMKVTHSSPVLAVCKTFCEKEEEESVALPVTLQVWQIGVHNTRAHVFLTAFQIRNGSGNETERLLHVLNDKILQYSLPAMDMLNGRTVFETHPQAHIRSYAHCVMMAMRSPHTRKQSFGKQQNEDISALPLIRPEQMHLGKCLSYPLDI